MQGCLTTTTPRGIPSHVYKAIGKATGKDTASAISTAGEDGVTKAMIPGMRRMRGVIRIWLRAIMRINTIAWTG